MKLCFCVSLLREKTTDGRVSDATCRPAGTEKILSTRTKRKCTVNRFRTPVTAMPKTDPRFAFEPSKSVLLDGIICDAVVAGMMGL